MNRRMRRFAGWCYQAVWCGCRSAIRWRRCSTQRSATGASGMIPADGKLISSSTGDVWALSRETLKALARHGQ